MDFKIHGKQMDLGDALKTHIQNKLEDLNQKYFNRAIDASVTLTPEGSSFIKTHISIRVGKDIMVMADTVEPDPYVSFDSAAEKVGKQLRRYKKRIRDHHERLEETPESEIMKARSYTLAAFPDAENDNQEEDDVPVGEDPIIIAEMDTDIRTMAVADAVMRLDLSGQNVMLFRNAQHNGLNVIYRRADGNIGWIDPEGNEQTAQATQAAHIQAAE